MIDEKTPEQRTIHFLPFNKANRDEDFGPGEDDARIAPLLTNTKAPETGGLKKDFNTLKGYLEAYRLKHGKKIEEFKSARPTTTPTPEANPLKAKVPAKGKKAGTLAQGSTADNLKSSEQLATNGDEFANNQAQKMASGLVATKKSPLTATSKHEPLALDQKNANLPAMG